MLLTRTPSRRSAALTLPELWRYSARLVPWTFVITTLGLAVAWGMRSRLDTATERSVLAILSTLALCAVLDDPAVKFTKATPTALWARRVTRAIPPVMTAFLVWISMLLIAPPGYEGPVESTPWWALALEWATLATSQLVVAALLALRAGAGSTVAPGMFVALLWLTAERLPALQRNLHPVSIHVWMWCALAAAGVGALVALSRDPGSRR